MKNTAIMAVNVRKRTFEVKNFNECMLFNVQSMMRQTITNTPFISVFSIQCEPNTHRVHTDKVTFSKQFDSLKLEIWCRYSNDIVSSTTHKTLLVVFRMWNLTLLTFVDQYMDPISNYTATTKVKIDEG